jgi:hypothetical protein
MRSGLLVGTVLGVGTALVFGAAALTASLFPNGTLVAQRWDGGIVPLRGAPFAPGGVPVQPGALDGDILVVDKLQAMPGDTVGGWPADPALP